MFHDRYKSLININVSKNETNFGSLYINIVNNEIQNIKIRRNNQNILCIHLPHILTNKNLYNPHKIGYTDKTLYGNPLTKNNPDIKYTGLYEIPIIFKSRNFSNEIINYKIHGNLNNSEVIHTKLHNLHILTFNGHIELLNQLNVDRKTNINSKLCLIELKKNDDLIHMIPINIKSESESSQKIINLINKTNTIKAEEILNNKFYKVKHIYNMYLDYKINKLYYLIYNNNKQNILNDTIIKKKFHLNDIKNLNLIKSFNYFIKKIDNCTLI